MTALTESFLFYARTGLKSMLADRAMVMTDFVLGTTTPFLVQFFIWSYIYTTGPDEIVSMTQQQTVFYYAFALVMGRLNNSYDVISRISENIREGTLEVYLVKPVGFMHQRLAIFLGESVLYMVPLAIVWILVKGQPSHWSLIEIASTVILVLVSQVLCFLIGFCVGLFCFWLVESTVLLTAVLVLSTVLGGFLLPPQFWPELVQPLMLYNPFRYLVAGPAQYMVSPFPEIFIELLVGSSIYIAMLSLLAWALWRKGLMRYHGAGG